MLLYGDMSSKYMHYIAIIDTFPHLVPGILLVYNFNIRVESLQIRAVSPQFYKFRHSCSPSHHHFFEELVFISSFSVVVVSYPIGSMFDMSHGSSCLSGCLSSCL